MLKDNNITEDMTKAFENCEKEEVNLSDKSSQKKKLLLCR